MPPDHSEITVRELAALLDGGQTVVLLDVRRDDERQLCSIPARATAHDLHVPMDEIPGRLEEVRTLGTRGPIVVYCHHGVRSRMVANWLAGQGLSRVINLQGGIDAWSLSVDRGVARY